MLGGSTRAEDAEQGAAEKAKEDSGGEGATSGKVAGT
jgi:hypothetical protein